MVKNNKKAISPVVATALLLVVAVVAVVGFQTWFNTYQSGLNVKVEEQSDSGGALTIERLQVNDTDASGRVYLKNVGSTAVSISSVTVSDCTANTTAMTITANNVSSQTFGGCSALAEGTAYDVVVLTPNGVVSGEFIAR